MVLFAANSATLRPLLHVCGCNLTYGRKKFSTDASLLKLTPKILLQPQLQNPLANLHHVYLYAQRDDQQTKNNSSMMLWTPVLLYNGLGKGMYCTGRASLDRLLSLAGSTYNKICPWGASHCSYYLPLIVDRYAHYSLALQTAGKCTGVIQQSQSPWALITIAGNLYDVTLHVLATIIDH